jgi:FSR family fosmidomycin resistance protein-like MFS transporter
MSLLGVAPSYAVLALLLVTAGCSAAVLHAVAPVLAGRLSGSQLGFGMGFWMVGGELGRTLGPVVVVSAIALLGLDGLPWLMVGGIAASTLLGVGLRGDNVPTAQPAKQRQFARAVRAMRPLLVPLAGVIVARSFMMAACTTYLPVFLLEQGCGLWLAGVSLSVLEGAGVVGALAGGSLSDKLGRRLVLAVSCVGTPTVMFGLLLVNGWGRFPLLLALGLVGLAVAPALMASVQESYPENRALANGIYMALNFVIRSVVVVLVGGVADRMGMRWTFSACAVLALLGTPFVMWLPEKDSGPQPPVNCQVSRSRRH